MVVNTSAFDLNLTADEEVSATHAKPQAKKELEMRCIQTLKTEKSWAQLYRACQILRIIGTTDSILPLAELLPNEKLSHLARYALEQMPFPEAGNALRDAVNKTGGTAKVGVIHSLGVRQDKEVVKLLIPLLKDLDIQVAGAAAWALGQAGTSEAAQALNEFCTSAPVSLKMAAIDAYLIVARRRLELGNAAEAAKIYEQLRAANAPMYIRMGAFVGLLRARPEQAESLLLKAINDKDPVMRGIAVDNIGLLKGPGVAKCFADELPKLPLDTKVLLIKVLADLGDKAILPTLITLSENSNLNISTVAVKALGNLGDATCVKTLVHVLAKDDSSPDKMAAKESLQWLTGPGVNEEIVKCMKKADPVLKAELIEELRGRRAVIAVPDLLQEAAGNDGKVQNAAFKTLADLAGPQDLPALIKLLVEIKSNDVRSQAERAVVIVSRKFENKQTCADAAIAAYQNARQSTERCSLLRVLQGIGDMKAFNVVQAALKDKDPDIIDTAVRALADWPDGQAIDTLLEVVQTTNNNTHCVVALRGCVRLLNFNPRPARETLNACKKLMQKAKRAEEKKLVLACLAKVADPGAISQVEPYLADAVVRAEAERALLDIAKAIMKSAPNQAKMAVNKLREQTKNEKIREEATALINKIGN